MLESLAEFKKYEDIEQVKYTNLYYIQNKFYYLTTKTYQNIKSIKTLGGPEHTGRINEKLYSINPIIKYFENEDKLNLFIYNLKCKEYKDPTLYFSHYYQHNIGHGLYDALYPIYLSYLTFFNNKEYHTFNMFVNLLIDPGGWRMPPNYIPTREWVLKVFKDFCLNGDFIIKPTINIKFNTLIAGSFNGGISFVNKKFIMFGKELFGLEKFRNRFLKVYNIKPITKTTINILIINSDRYTKQERHTFKQIIDIYSNREDIHISYIDWKDISIFKNQIQLVHNCDIHISGSGTSMMNFPFLKQNSIHINLGTLFDKNKLLYSLMETNICLLSNDIYCDMYDIYNHKSILYDKLKNCIDTHIHNLKNKCYLKSEIPLYTKKWQLFCHKYPDKANEYIERLRGLKKPNWIGYRYPDTVILYDPEIYY